MAALTVFTLWMFYSTVSAVYQGDIRAKKQSVTLNPGANSSKRTSGPPRMAGISGLLARTGRYSHPSKEQQSYVCLAVVLR
ncbi:hypothetical protein J6590_049701 [Homalodisca vitripennis]|nr:hypothetical protein J6590_049701 [Homalodisca vitripennis]